MKIVIDIPDDNYKRIRELAEVNGLSNNLMGYSLLAIAHGTPLVTCKDCKHQIKEFRSDKRMKNGGVWVKACDIFGDICGYWAWGGSDEEYCSEAERKDGGE